jgi:hypothetical protein
MSTIETTTDKDTDHPIVSLTEGRSERWYQAFDDYVKWPHGGAVPAGIEGGGSFSTAVLNGTFERRASHVIMKLAPGDSLRDVDSFLMDAIRHADKVTDEQ